MAKKSDKPSYLLQGMTEEELVTLLVSRRDADTAQYPNTKWKGDDKVLRHQLLLYWLTRGMSKAGVVRKCSNLFGVSEAAGWTWVKEAIQYLNARADEFRDYVRDEQIGKLEELVNTCVTSGKMREAMMGMEQLNKIYGLYSESKEIKVKTDEPIKFEFDKG